ncbi:hypothetical protein BGZ99_008069, partial [Dissophora globulifera]
MSASDERNREITLNERHILNTSGSALKCGNNFSVALSNDAFVAEDTGLYFDNDGNLIDHPYDSVFQNFGDPSMALQGLDTGNARVPSCAEHGPPGESLTLVKQPRDHGPAEMPADIEDHTMIAKHGDSGGHLNGEDQGWVDYNYHQDDDAGLVPQQARCGVRLPRSKRLTVDINTELPPQDVITDRVNYPAIQAELMRDLDLKHEAMRVKAWINSMLELPHGVVCVSPELKEFWISVSTRSIDNMPLRPRGRATIQNDSHADEKDVHNDIDPDIGRFEDLPEPPEPEMRRRHPSTDTTSASAGLEISGIGGVALDHRRSGIMPWSFDLRTSADGRSEHSSGGSDRLGQEFETIFDPTTGKNVRRQRKASGTSRSSVDLADMQDETLSNRRQGYLARSRSASRSQDASRASSRHRADGGSQGASMDSHGLFTEFGDQDADEIGGASSSQALNPIATEERRVIERETVNFLSYVRSILREANAASFSLSDVISVHHRREVAAAAFYHIL